MLSVVSADYKEEYKILVRFNDDRKGEVDLKDFIFNGKIKPFRQLQDVEKFRDFKVDYTLKWGDELDLAPEYLYFKAFGDQEELKNVFEKWGYA